MGTERKAYFALALVCLVWGVSWVGTKEAVRYMPPFQMVGIRQILAGSAYVLYFLLRGAKLPRKKEWYPILLLSVLSFMISNGLATLGVKLTTAGLSAIMGAIFPLWLVMILAIRGKNRIPPLAWIGILVGFSGVCIVFYEHLHELFNFSFLGGITLGLIASLAWAYATIYTKEFALDFNPYHSIGWQMLISGCTLTIIAQISGDSHHSDRSNFRRGHSAEGNKTIYLECHLFPGGGKFYHRISCILVCIAKITYRYCIRLCICQPYRSGTGRQFIYWRTIDSVDYHRIVSDTCWCLYRQQGVA